MAALHSDKISHAKQSTSDIVLFIGGLSITLIAGFLYICSGESAFFQIHDQLDGEILTYIFASMHPNASQYPEIMDGLPATGLQMASPGLIVFFSNMPACQALAASATLEIVVAYIGMWLLLKSLGVRNWICLITSMLFAFLPLRPVYGLCMFGIPLLTWSYIKAFFANNKLSWLLAAAVTAFYGVFSSPILIGFAVIFLQLTACAIFIIRGHKAQGAKILLMATLLAAIYICLNFNIVIEFLASSEPGHKTEIINSSFGVSVVDFILKGQTHTISNQQYIVYIALPALIASGLIVSPRFKTRNLEKQSINSIQSIKTNCKTLALWICIAWTLIILIALFYSFFHSNTISEIRNNLPGTLKSFQFDRSYWLYPALWFLLLGTSSELFIRLFAQIKIRGKASVTLQIAISILIITFIFVPTAYLDYQKSYIPPTIKQSLGHKTSMTGSATWRSFFGSALFDQMKSDLHIDDHYQTKVVSLGLYPSIATYNGLNSLDGYSNNYPLAHKHKFRKVIQNELALSPRLQTYYDNWGNRCYLFSHELDRNFFLNKSSETIVRDLRVDTNALSSLGCHYIISAAKINISINENLSLKWQANSPAVPYELYVYELVN